ncbi:transmembrane protein, putative, partial (macronuclear) [Tetrahymena thermophila SB210]
NPIFYYYMDSKQISYFIFKLFDIYLLFLHNQVIPIFYYYKNTNILLEISSFLTFVCSFYQKSSQLQNLFL